MNTIARYVKALWKLFDVIGWQKWFGASVLGFAFALSTDDGFSAYQLQGFLIGISLVLCYNQSINDCFDIEIDKTKEEYTGKESVVSKVISRRTALYLTFVILMIGLASSGISSFQLFLITLLMAFLGTIYSAPPLRLKMNYPFSTLIQFVGSFLPFLAGFVAIRAITWQAIMISSLFSFLAMVHRLDHEIFFYKVDIDTGKNTVAVVKGLKIARTLRRICLLTGITEFIAFFALGLFDLTFLSLFVFYLLLCVEHSAWLHLLPAFLKETIAPLLKISSFVLFLFVLFLFWSSAI